ncbi:hypothetical protein KR026_011704, partial [Drosophila bipectinata]
KKAKQAKPIAPKDAETMRAIVEHLFPKQLSGVESPGPSRAREPAGSMPAQEIGVHEIVEVAKAIQVGKASGPDGIPDSAIKLAMTACPDRFARVFNACLQSLVLLPKPGKPPEHPSSLRPICLIEHADKALERCICRRLQEAVIRAGDLSPLQYGLDLPERTHLVGFADDIAVVVVATSGRGVATINIGGHVVTSTRAIRYLGVTLDTRLSFREHFV